MKNGCCIVETRIIPNLLEIIQEKHLNFVPDDWGLTLFLSEQNKHLINEKMFKRDVQIFILPNEFSIHDYNRLLTSVEFWDKLPYEKVLIFQTDSELLRSGIEQFIFPQLEFLGAPSKEYYPMMNGGLSIRDVKKCKMNCMIYPYDGQRNEDWHFCVFMLHNIQPKKVAQRFSIEQEFVLGSLGCHAIDKYFTPEQCSQIRNQYK